MPPTVVLNAKIDLDEWAPLGTFWFSNQVHTGFLGRLIGLLRVAPDAGANDVLPGCRAAAVSRNNVVEVQIPAFKDVAAVLAGIAVALEDIVAGEFDLLFRQPVKHQQQNDARHTNFEGNGGNGFRMRFLLGEVAPLKKTESLESAVGISKNDLGVAFEYKSQGAAGGADVDRLPKAVEDQNVLIEKGAHIEQLGAEPTIRPPKVSTPHVSRGLTPCHGNDLPRSSRFH